MSRAQALLSTLILLVLSSIAMAQSEAAKLDKSSSATITAFASGERVRFAAQSEVVQIRLEVYNSTGIKLFDDEVRGGNVLDWRLRDGQAAPLADDSYVCVVTVKSLSGRMSQRIGLVTVEGSTARLQPFDTSQMTGQQKQAIGPIEDNASWTLLKDDENRTTTVIAHNGEEGQITRGTGPLTFRIGDFFSGRDTEQMRLTAEGNLGIGITHPQVRLDVDGMIRASKGIMFPDGTIQTTAATAGSDRQGRAGQLRAGSGSKQVTLGNASGKAGKGNGTVSPEFMVNDDLTVNGSIFFTTGSPRDIAMLNNTGGIRIYSAPSLTNSPASAAIQFFGTGSAFTGQAYIDSGAHDNAAVIFRTAKTGGTIAERMRITATGNIGISTTNPQSPLDVAGDIDTTTGFNIAGNRVLSVTGAGPNIYTNTFVGVNSGSSNTPSSNDLGGNLNTFFGFNSGNNNTTGGFNTLLGAYAGFQTTMGSANTFLGVNTGRFNTTGQSNTFLGAEAGQSNTGGPGNQGSFNTFVGESAGIGNLTGGVNAFFGQGAGANNTTGNANSFFGYNAGFTNINRSYNTLLGYLTDGFAASNATAIGAYAQVTQDNSLVLGAINGVNGAGADTLVGIGTTAPAAKLHVSGGAILLDNNQGLYLKSNGGAQKRVLLADTIDTLHVGSGGVSGFDQIRFDLGTPGTVMTMLSSGNVGIGTTTPNATLEVAGSAPSLGRFTNKGTGTDHTTLVDLLNGENKQWRMGVGGTGNGLGLTGGQFYIEQSGSGARMVFDTNGDVGIGTTAPAAKLHVSGGAVLLDNNQGVFLKDSTGAQKRVLLADTLNRLHIGSGGSLGLDEIRFDLATPGTVMTMVSTGDVGIGTVPLDKLQVAGDIRIGTGTTGCVKDADGTVIAGACSSDARLKRDITPFPRLLDKLVRLQPVHFYWDTKARPDRAFGDSVSFGLVAQEVEKVMPELVTEDEQGFKAVRYNKLPLLTLQAIKELKEDNDSLRRNNSRLESHVAALKRLVCLDHPDADVCRPR